LYFFFAAIAWASSNARRLFPTLPITGRRHVRDVKVLRPKHQHEEHEGSETETHEHGVVATREAHTVREHLNDVLSAQHRYGELVQDGWVREASLEETDQGSANRLVDGGHSRHDRTDAPGAEHSVAKASTRYSHLDDVEQPTFHVVERSIADRLPLSSEGYEEAAI
jgi:hypothetical protein